jgi:polysaccharide export outer membrane protein
MKLRLAGGWAVIAAILFFTACTSRKNLAYFQGNVANQNSNEVQNNLIFKTHDLLSIVVMGLNPESVAPFNLPDFHAYTTSGVGGYSQGSPTPPGYLIDAEGNVDFPVIGKLHFAGLTRSAAIELLKSKLSEYINKPSVIIRILNFKVTVLGEVKNPGTFTIPNERVTILEALGIAGDLLITGVRKNVLVIRDLGGVKSETRVDLTSTEVFNSPVYFLQQNDIVYVEPNKARVNSSVVNASNISISISILSLMVTMITLLSR